MPVRKIIQRGDPVLNKKAHPVTSFDEKLHTLLDEMKETLDRADGVGLAAPQLGLLRRVVLVLDTNDDNKPIELVNPRIIASSGEERGVEGCLSVAGLYGYVTRPTEVTVEAQDRYGKTFTVKAMNNSDTNIYVQSATLNGQPYDKSYIDYRDIIAGGTLELTMGPKPSKWGTGTKARP